MNKRLMLMVICFAFTPRASQAQRVPVVITTDYYAQPKVLVMHARNNSGKDITGYTFLIRPKNPDGTIDKGSRNEYTTDMLSVLITAQMAKDPAASERIRQQNAGNNFSRTASPGNGIFVADETRDMTLTAVNSGSEFDVTAGAVFYADGSYDQQDEDTFKRMLTVRQEQLQEIKDTNESIRSALADPTNDHPVAAVLKELNKRQEEATEKARQTYFYMYHPYLEGIQRPQKGTTERERLLQYVEEQDKRIELMTPHCHLEIALNK